LRTIRTRFTWLQNSRLLTIRSRGQTIELTMSPAILTTSKRQPIQKLGVFSCFWLCSSAQEAHRIRRSLMQGIRLPNAPMWALRDCRHEFRAVERLQQPGRPCSPHVETLRTVPQNRIVEQWLLNSGTRMLPDPLPKPGCRAHAAGECTTLNSRRESQQRIRNGSRCITHFAPHRLPPHRSGPSGHHAARFSTNQYAHLDRSRWTPTIGSARPEYKP
jgi:hypothetical protein